MLAYPACAHGLSYPRRRCDGGPGLIRSLIGSYIERKAQQQQAERQQYQQQAQQVQGPEYSRPQLVQGVMPPPDGLARRLSAGEEKEDIDVNDDATEPMGGERPPRYEEVMKS